MGGPGHLGPRRTGCPPVCTGELDGRQTAVTMGEWGQHRTSEASGAAGGGLGDRGRQAEVDGPLWGCQKPGVGWGCLLHAPPSPHSLQTGHFRADTPWSSTRTRVRCLRRTHRGHRLRPHRGHIVSKAVRGQAQPFLETHACVSFVYNRVSLSRV